MPRVINGYEFSPRQEEAIGQLVIDHWGGHIVQTGFDEYKIPCIYFKMGPNLPIKRFTVESDGTVAVA